MSFEDLSKVILEYHPSPNLELVKKAYNFAREKHKDQKRKSGEPYFVHLEQTALLICKIRLDEDTICAALLHDVIEDQHVTRQELIDEFNEQIADIVEGVTKLAKTNYQSREEAQAESFRKMLIAMAKDIRVILVKLCDRLHNMRTLEFKDEEAQERISRETKDIYVPLANRLGIFWLKSELDDLCLKYLRPSLYEEIERELGAKRLEREEYIKNTCEKIKEILDENHINARIKGRVKNMASLATKMEQKNITFAEIKDLIGFRIIVSSIKECYETLGIIHSKWAPIPGRIKDYIAMPKPNMYQSLHTLVMGPLGQKIELQVRTEDMDKVAEEGIAAHWKYKEKKGSSTFDLQWVKSLVETQQYLKNPDEFIQSVKSELFPEELFVFTPKGDLIRLPFEATPVDFAYAIHSDVGNTIIGAKVNGGIVPLSHKLQNGDVVEVQCAKNQMPNRDWLFFVKSSKARQRIKVFLRTEERARALIIGNDILTRELRKYNANINKFNKSGKLLEVAKSIGFKSEGELFYQLGFGKANLNEIISKLIPENEILKAENKVKEFQNESTISKILKRATNPVTKKKAGIKVGALDNVVVNFAKCCDPLPGDKIVGFISRGRGIIVHNALCPEVTRLDPERRVDVSWDNEESSSKNIKIAIYSQDRIGLFGDLSKVISENNANIFNASAKVDDFAKAKTIFEINIKSAKQLDKIIKSLQKVNGVTRVERIHYDSSSDNSSGK
ncbi:MAG: bifunctional (p)ppGpp synthetase/guanosine-3',5'-bis(diphosphate) 3'-pyrophosphohydrolase [Bdellovibrionota bacterium]|nr:bifunctional (p)ppGpp synthetase/guanosine-3',5'-bis(diphosphate) 3'-pyrophosphohydrolase [Bdellovibrionota bacterium]